MREEAVMINSLGINAIESPGDAVMDDQELVQRRKTRTQRIKRAKSRGGSKTFFASPYAALICMLVALGSIVGFWRGVPSWALLAIGMAAVIIIAMAGFFWRSTRR